MLNQNWTFHEQYLLIVNQRSGVLNLCDTKGFAYKFEIYSSKTEKLAQDEPNLQPAANIVVRLLRAVPRFENNKIYFDSYFATVPPLLYLSSSK